SSESAHEQNQITAESGDPGKLSVIVSARHGNTYKADESKLDSRMVKISQASGFEQFTRAAEISGKKFKTRCFRDNSDRIVQPVLSMSKWIECIDEQAYRCVR